MIGKVDPDASKFDNGASRKELVIGSVLPEASLVDKRTSILSKLAFVTACAVSL